MPIPVFEQQVVEELKEIETKKEKVSPWSVLISILLVTILIVMGEYAFRDSNRVFNPYYDPCYRPISYNSVTFLQQIGRPDQTCDMRAYEGTQLLLQVDIGAPILLVGLLVLLLVRKKTLSSTQKVLMTAFYIFMVWMSVRVIYETEAFLVKHYPLAGKYVVFLSISVICTVLIVLIQSKLKRKAI
jgi:hypothetical protein